MVVAAIVAFVDKTADRKKDRPLLVVAVVRMPYNACGVWKRRRWWRRQHHDGKHEFSVSWKSEIRPVVVVGRGKGSASSIRRQQKFNQLCDVLNIILSEEEAEEAVKRKNNILRNKPPCSSWLLVWRLLFTDKGRDQICRRRPTYRCHKSKKGDLVQEARADTFDNCR